MAYEQRIDNENEEIHEAPQQVMTLLGYGIENPGNAALNPTSSAISNPLSAVKSSLRAPYRSAMSSSAEVVAGASLCANGTVQLGDVAFLNAAGSHTAGHAMMCVGFNGKHEPMWCSDTPQGTNFFVSDDYRRCGTYTIYHCTNPLYNAQKAVDTLLSHAASCYTGECARNVREYGIDAGLGYDIQHQKTAADYNNSGELLNYGFKIVAHGTAQESSSLSSAKKLPAFPKGPSILNKRMS